MAGGQEMRVSVRQMVEFICRSGDLSSGGFSSPQRALEGTRVHQKLQKNREASYRSEVSLSLRTELGDLALTVEGRADGIGEQQNPECPYFIEEIKSTYASAEQLGFSYEPTHRGQLLCYGYIWSLQEQLSKISLRLTYYQMETDKEYSFEEDWTFEDLKAFFLEVVEQYGRWMRWQREHLKKRTDSLKTLSFPFPAYRGGQRTMAAYVYKTIQDGGGLFLQAPTGIGKTISALFPALKAMGEGLTSKLFYLTAKSATALAAQEAIERLRTQTRELICVSLTAKDKICLLEERRCSPQECPYAKGHYDRINQAVFAALTQDCPFDRARIHSYSKQFPVCPFELSLDLATWADVIIGDYNYAFDPTASLKRFFQEQKTDYTLLVDEAHNLPDRAQSMYSAVLGKQAFRRLQKSWKTKPASYRRALRRSLKQLIQWFEEREEGMQDGEFTTFKEPDPELCETLAQFNGHLADFLTQEGAGEEEWLLLYFQVLFFLKMQEEYDESSVTYLEKQPEDLIYHIFCIHPARKLKQRYEKVGAVILFSATLLPIEYYRELLGGKDPDWPMDAIYLDSPFDPDHKKVLIASGIRTDYQSRDRTLGAVAAAIYRTVQTRRGNYLVFFPSYPYLKQVLNFFQEAYPELEVWEQTPGMTEEERENWLNRFQEGPPWGIGFCVLGGSFSEGIDLRGKRLIGCIIITVGLPQICMERDLIRDYMDRLCGQGFDYAYRYPGLNKVFQAAGRVIRTEEDRGVIVLIDSRYVQERYRRAFPPDWQPTPVRSEEIGTVLEKFWKKQELE